MKKILVPVDFSGHTDITCKYALEIAKVYGGEIRLFHTYFDQIIIADTSFPDTLDMSTVYNEELMKEIHRQAVSSMEALYKQVNGQIADQKIQDVVLTSGVTGGEIENELREICHEFKPDVVVMGTTGKGNNVNVWGKVSTFIIDHARVPVLTVPQILEYRGFGSIMFAADLSEANAASIAEILDLFHPFEFKLKVVHFITKAKNVDAHSRMEILRRQFSAQEQKGIVTFEVIESMDDNQKAIDQFIGGNQIRMIAFQPHKRSLLYMVFTKNITKKNLFATNIPLLAVPTRK